MEGGSGNFTWASSNETVAMVTTKGVVTVGQVRGNSTVLARDVQNPFRYGEIKVSNFPNNLYTSSETVLSKFNYGNALKFFPFQADCFKMILRSSLVSSG